MQIVQVMRISMDETMALKGTNCDHRCEVLFIISRSKTRLDCKQRSSTNNHSFFEKVLYNELQSSIEFTMAISVGEGPSGLTC